MLVSPRTFAAALMIVLSAEAALAGAPSPCREQALARLKKVDQQAYNDMATSKDRNTFDGFLMCSESDLGLSSAYHEGIHGITVKDYTLYNGAKLSQPRSIKMEPREVADQVKTLGKNSTLDGYKQTYFLGDASAKELYFILLDEFNAYTRQLITTAALVKGGFDGGNQSGRDGAAAMMLFLKLTVERARVAHPSDWVEMQKPEHLAVIRALWAQAEKGLEIACPIEGLGMEDATIMSQVYASENLTALTKLLGRTPTYTPSCAPSKHVDESPYDPSAVLTSQTYEVTTEIVVESTGEEIVSED